MQRQIFNISVLKVKYVQITKYNYYNEYTEKYYKFVIFLAPETSVGPYIGPYIYCRPLYTSLRDGLSVTSQHHQQQQQRIGGSV